MYRAYKRSISGLATGLELFCIRGRDWTRVDGDTFDKYFNTHCVSTMSVPEEQEFVLEQLEAICGSGQCAQEDRGVHEQGEEDSEGD